MPLIILILLCPFAIMGIPIAIGIIALKLQFLFWAITQIIKLVGIWFVFYLFHFLHSLFYDHYVAKKEVSQGNYSNIPYLEGARKKIESWLLTFISVGSCALLLSSVLSDTTGRLKESILSFPGGNFLVNIATKITSGSYTYVELLEGLFVGLLVFTVLAFLTSQVQARFDRLVDILIKACCLIFRKIFNKSQ